MAARAHIFQINASQGGVPKYPIFEAEVNELGLSADAHRNTKAHGGPERALCLYALELILALQQEGHAIFPGSTGENITIAGLDWERVAPGTRLTLGDDVLVEVTRYTTPCASIAASFLGLDSSRLSQEKHPGWARVYARVLRSGRIHVSDAVRIVE